MTKEAANRILALLDTKDERTGTIVRMRVDGYSYSEISETLSISENSARVIDYRVKKWIKSVLEQEGLQ
ncbi:sigma factor-like helix-turn-helix DNA-binding protein [Paenibacillus sp. BR1-192]|uniref:RNA polymerase sigma factor n=1 Tax=Paenibacillus sp. BR1-192 TaxID=3032287 RepID=UPI00240E4AC2|nr:sigma factor-like helix-turn-helix DNA-binding protein [Paenibacillus sp. BR1-192]WFB59801.1 sigma factor-like helix-turn-helix DNA-binding protein [Paenibacillus sp. BR1-192]